MTPTSRTLGLLRKLGYSADVVERWIPGANIRKDLFGFGDVLAVHPVQRVFLIVQATTVGHVTHRLAKARSKPELATWLAAGGLFEIWGWSKRESRWTARRVGIQAGDLQPVEITPRPPRRKRATKSDRGLFD